MEKMLTHIRPPGRFTSGWREVWQYRELFYFFTWRDIRVKYKQTTLGILWVVLQPLGMMLLFTLIIARNWQMDTGGLPYPVFVLAGLILWSLFSNAVSHAGESMIQHAGIIKKIYFPRLIIPGSAVLSALVDFFAGLMIFFALLIFYGQSLHWFSPFYFGAGLLLLLTTALGAGILLSALNVKYRDFRYTISFLLQLLFFSSQVIYPLCSIPQEWLRILLSFNPVNTSIGLFRAGLGAPSPGIQEILAGLCVTLLLLVTGLFFFRKTEAYFADIA
ncbi:MAG: ABC transporter permease [Chitinophagaceae bacterium]|nr:ABC transporter permease [Chitinophagaceae bacterium]